MGVFINELINFILKNMFKHERPNSKFNNLKLNFKVKEFIFYFNFNNKKHQEI